MPFEDLFPVRRILKISRAKEEGTFGRATIALSAAKYFAMIFRLGYQNCCEYESGDNCTFCASCQIKHRGSFARIGRLDAV
jgi:hypothetical protein